MTVEVGSDQIPGRKANLLKTKMTKNANKAAVRRAKVEKVGPDLDPSLPDPVAQIATLTQILGK